jgi:hypothetical protein
MEHAIVIQPGDMDKFISQIVDRAIEKIVKIKTAEPTRTKAQAAKYLQISVQTLEKRFRDNELPASLIHRNGGTPYFFESELEQYLKKSKS